jgi:hypothetical protein
MVSLSEKDNTMDPGKHISTLISSALDLLTPKLIGNIILPWVVHMCDTVSLSEKDNTTEPGKNISTSISPCEIFLIHPKKSKENPKINSREFS